MTLRIADGWRVGPNSAPGAQPRPMSRVVAQRRPSDATPNQTRKGYGVVEMSWAQARATRKRQRRRDRGPSQPLRLAQGDVMGWLVTW